jgi:hypothetical protein
VTSVVYFIRIEGGNIKIGTTTNMRRRMAAFATGICDPFSLVGCVPGGREEEREIHNRLARWRVRGEWFKPAKEVTTFIENAIAQNGCESPIQPDTEADSETRVAASWARKSAELISEARGIPLAQARDIFAERSGIAKGTIYNLSRNRMLAISARDWELIRKAYAGVLEEEIRSLEGKLDIARKVAAANQSGRQLDLLENQVTR